MKKADFPAFFEFMLDEATRYARPLTKPEVETWFENFPRVKLEDFKAAWFEHKRDSDDGKYFPKITHLQRRLRIVGQDQAARDWRCGEEINGQRCGYPGGIHVGFGAQCMAHYRLHNSSAYSSTTSLQIIEASTSYVPPKNAMEILDRGSEQREEEGARWRESHPAMYAGLRTIRLGADPIPRAQLPERPEAERTVDDLDAMNQEAALAAGEE